MEEEQILIQITKKGKKLFKEVEDAYKEWLKASNLTDKELMSYKSVTGFHIIDKKEGIALGYYDKNKEEKMIGGGICRECLNTAFWIFAYICARLDDSNNYKSDFSKILLKWSKKNNKRRK